MGPKQLVFLVLLAIFSLALNPSSWHRVKYVFDGDTILLQNREKVRYLGIDAPEIDHEGGKSEFMALDARKFNMNSVAGFPIRLEFDGEKRDRYGRLLAYVFLETGDMVNALLVRRGLAHVMFTNGNIGYEDQLLRCQRQAMKEKLGIWSRPCRGNEKFYLGNRNSHRFHRPGCRFAKKISRKNTVRLKSRYDAFWEGYSPCNRCLP
jgi:micrococcal nuclease